MKKIQTIILSLLTVLALSPVTVHAQSLFDGSKNAVCSGAVLKEGATCDEVSGGKKDPAELVTLALNIFTTIIGIIAVVMILIGGVKYVTSQGEAAQTNSAKNTILYALIGIVIALLAQVIVRFVLAKFKA